MNELNVERKERSHKYYLEHRESILSYYKKRYKPASLPHKKSGFKKGCIPWNKGKHDLQVSWCKGIPMREESKQKLRLSHLGMKHTEETKEKIRLGRRKTIIPSKDTKPERMLQLGLILRNIKFRTHEPILGQPDIFIEPNICIFVDGCFWHGCKKCYNKFHSKLLEKLKRDAEVNHTLNIKGYHVIRIWEHDIHNNLNQHVDNILYLISSSLTSHNKKGEVVKKRFIS